MQKQSQDQLVAIAIIQASGNGDMYHNRFQIYLKGREESVFQSTRKRKKDKDNAKISGKSNCQIQVVYSGVISTQQSLKHYKNNRSGR